jgi:DNA uptake protein ComE-like DNA-binding protein
MNHTHVPSVARHTAALLLLVVLAACQSRSDDAAQPDSAATTQPATAASAPDSQVASGRDVSAGAAAPAGGTLNSSAMLDPNAASREELTAVPGMTAPAADALIGGRPYETMVAVDQALAKHLSAAGRKTVYARLWKPLDLNSARGDEILLIPGVGPRMRHEFEEYRPYRSIEQFRREIGKYVDRDEVARLERYVTIR